MKYLTITPTGFELRSDTSQELPTNSVELSEDEYIGLLNGTLQYVNEKIIPV
jgi:hypothetical protein